MQLKRVGDVLAQPQQTPRQWVVLPDDAPWNILALTPCHQRRVTQASQKGQKHKTCTMENHTEDLAIEMNLNSGPLPEFQMAESGSRFGFHTQTPKQPSFAPQTANTAAPRVQGWAVTSQTTTTTQLVSQQPHIPQDSVATECNSRPTSSFHPWPLSMVPEVLSTSSTPDPFVSCTASITLSGSSKRTTEKNSFKPSQTEHEESCNSNDGPWSSLDDAGDAKDAEDEAPHGCAGSNDVPDSDCMLEDAEPHELDDVPPPPVPTCTAVISMVKVFDMVIEIHYCDIWDPHQYTGYIQISGYLAREALEIQHQVRACPSVPLQILWDGELGLEILQVGQMGMEIAPGGEMELKIPQGGTWKYSSGLEVPQGSQRGLEILQGGHMVLEILQGGTWRFPRVVKWGWRFSRGGVGDSPGGHLEIPQGGQMGLEILQGDTWSFPRVVKWGWRFSRGAVEDSPGWSNGIGDSPGGHLQILHRDTCKFSSWSNGIGDSPGGQLEIPQGGQMVLEISQDSPGWSNRAGEYPGGHLEILHGGTWIFSSGGYGVGDSPGWSNGIGGSPGGQLEIPLGGQMGLEILQGGSWGFSKGTFGDSQGGQMRLEILQGDIWSFPKVAKWGWRFSRGAVGDSPRGHLEIPQGGQMGLEILWGDTWRFPRVVKWGWNFPMGQSVQGDTWRFPRAVKWDWRFSGGMLGDTPGRQEIPQCCQMGLDDIYGETWRFSMGAPGDSPGWPNGIGDSPGGHLDMPQSGQMGVGHSPGWSNRVGKYPGGHLEIPQEGSWRFSIGALINSAVGAMGWTFFYWHTWRFSSVCYWVGDLPRWHLGIPQGGELGLEILQGPHGDSLRWSNGVGDSLMGAIGLDILQGAVGDSAWVHLGFFQWVLILQ
ncbi:hypothetical protein EDD17DRAFT_1762593 [Pisolithus thermaeus]|nr:hypothetical protein EDD17DRAFT_1762593 [Pisolithus thermaeus]